MKRISLLAVFSAVIALVPAMRSTTVIAPTFDQLVNDAEVIFQGSVTDVQAQWVGEGAQRHIVSYVTFQVEDAVKGEPSQSYVMRMFGGTVDGVTMAVSDSPSFNVGDRDILFVEHNGTQFIPLVGIMHGRFQVQQDQTGNDVVVRADGAPVKDVARLGHAESMSPDAGGNLSPEQFKAAIRARLQVVR